MGNNKIVNLITDSVGYYRAISKLANLWSQSGTASAPAKRTILINNVNFCQLPTLYFETLLATKLRLLGAKVIHLVDDRILPHIDLDHIETFFKEKNFSPREFIFWNILKHFGLHVRYSDFVGLSNIARADDIAAKMVASKDYRHLGIDLLPHVESSVIRVFKSAKEFVSEEIRYLDVLRVCAKNAVISANVAQAAERLYRPEIVITSHGIYSTYGPFYDYFRLSGKRTITWCLSDFRHGHVLLSHGGLVANRDDDGYFLNKNTDLKLEEARDFAERVMSDRFGGKAHDLQRLQYTSADPLILNKLSRIADNTDLYAVFPNIFWDNSITGIDTIFDSATQWLLETIRYFEEQEHKHLVIRAHPVEAISGTSVTTSMIIERGIGRPARELSNCTFIDSAERIRSYELFPLLKSGIIYNGTLGLELMYKGLPVIVGGKAPYCGHGFTLDFRQRSEYFQAIDDVEPIKVLQVAERDKICKYIDHFFRLNHIPIAAFSKDHHATLATNLSGKEMIDDESLDHIAYVILGNRSYFQDWFFTRSRSAA